VKRTIPGEWLTALVTPAGNDLPPGEAAYYGYRGNTRPASKTAPASKTETAPTPLASSEPATPSPQPETPPDSVTQAPVPVTEAPARETETLTPDSVAGTEPQDASPEPATAQPASSGKKPREFELREWKDATGQFSLQARFSGLIGGNIKLKRADGQVLTVPLNKLSEADQEYIDMLRK
jgi:hypothetical protein